VLVLEVPHRLVLSLELLLSLSSPGLLFVCPDLGEVQERRLVLVIIVAPEELLLGEGQLVFELHNDSAGLLVLRLLLADHVFLLGLTL